MATLADFVRIPKIDCHNNLQAGMRYAAFVRWSGFYIPGFPENGVCYDSSLKDDFRFYTKVKINSKKDIQSLFYMSIADQAADNVKVLHGGIDLELCEKCENPADFIAAINEVKEKYAETVDIKPELIINSNVDTNLFLAETFIENQNFTGVILTGSNFCGNNVQHYENIFNSARKESLNTTVDCVEVKTSADLNFALTTYKPDSVKDIKSDICDESILSFIKQAEITVIFSSYTESSASEVIQKKYEFIRKLADMGIKIRICSASALFLCKSISEFAADLCNTGLFTEEEVKTFFSCE